MSKAVGKVIKVAISPISLIIGDKATSALLSIAAMIPGPQQPFLAVAATAFNVAARVTAPKPNARGSVTNIIVEPEPPRPYMMGESYFAGVLRHQVGYGAALKKVPNPYLLRTIVYSSVGPVNALVEKQFDFSAIGGYYSGFYDTDEQLGARPEAAALVPPYGTAPGWTASSKLSGCAAIAWNHKFDKDGKVYASGLPVVGAIWQGEKVYDPRLDSTRPGGSGTHRIDDETTWAYSRSPALHAGTYAYGRYEGTKKIFGIGVDDDGIDWPNVALWANDCDANGWEVHGVIFEGGSQSGAAVKAGNLDDICAAGGGRWLAAGALLSFDWHRPRTALATITDADLMEEGGDIISLQTHRDRFNAVLPQYRSPSHNWEMITADKIAGSTYVTEDGAEKVQTWPFNLVKAGDQAAELACYALADSREIGPINYTLGAEWRFYKPGDTLHIQSEATGLDVDVVILRRSIDPDTLKVTMTFKSETAGKHAFALGKTATPPPTPVIGQTAEDRDAVKAGATSPAGYEESLILNSYVSNAGGANPVTATDAGTDSTINIAAHTRVYADKTQAISAGSITALAYSTVYLIYYDDESRSDPSPAFIATTNAALAYNTPDYPDRHFVGAIVTPASGGGDSDGGGAGPPGSGSGPYP